VERHPMIAHNSSFDLGYLIKSCHDFQIEFPPLDIYDSCRYVRAIYKKLDVAPKNYKLSTLCEYFHVPFQHHVAIEDTFACLKVTAAAAKMDADHRKALEKSFVFRLSSFYQNDCFNFSERLNGLKEMVQKKDLVQLDYRGKNMKGIRPVRPIGLMPLPKGPVLFAECLISGMNKSFLLKKIKNYSRLEASLWRNGETI
jgi:DNA polymerase III epsilon subunit-like protein